MKVIKVVVIGPPEAGKSTLIGALSPNAINLAVRGRTVAMDHATFARNGVAVSLVGVPGQTRFAGVREVLAKGARLAVWVHPADHSPDQETARIVGQLADGGVPYVVFVNHRSVGPWPDGWAPPRSAPEPTSVVHGNLGDPECSLEPLEESIVRLAV